MVNFESGISVSIPVIICGFMEREMAQGHVCLTTFRLPLPVFTPLMVHIHSSIIPAWWNRPIYGVSNEDISPTLTIKFTFNCRLFCSWSWRNKSRQLGCKNCMFQNNFWYFITL